MRAELARLIAMVRRIAGMPDYAAYAEHMRTHHPGQPLPSEREFFEEYVERRYGRGGTRCC